MRALALALLLAAPAGAEEAPKEEELLEGASVTVIGRRDGVSGTSLEKEELDEVRSAGRLRQALERIPGLESTGLQGAGGASQISIRGGESRHSAVFIDGQRQPEGFDLGSIPVGEIERVEVLRGPEALAYSPAALAGAVLITTRGEGGKSWGLSALGGDFSTARGRFSTPEFKAGILGSGLSGGYARTGGYVDNTDEEAWDLSQRLTLELPQDRIQLKAYLLRRLGGAPFGRSLAAQGSHDVDMDDREDKWAWNASLSDERAMGAWNFAPSLSVNSGWVRRLNPVGADAEAGVEQDHAALRGAWNLELPWVRRGQGSEMAWTFRARRETQIDPLGWRSRDSASLGLRAALKLGAAELKASARVEADQGISVPAYLPQAELSWRPLSGLGFSLSAGQGRRLPDFEQLYRATIAFGPTAPEGFGEGEKGNPFLQPESSSNAQAGLQWEGGRHTFKLCGFANFTRGLILPMEDESDEYWTYLNLDSTRALGLEASLEMRLGPFSPFANYTIIDSMEHASGGPIPGRLRQKLGCGASYRMPWNLTLKAGARYLERYQVTLLDPDDADASAPSVTVTDFNASLEWLLGPHRFFLHVDNLADQHYADAIGLPSRGRYAEVGAEMEF